MQLTHRTATVVGLCVLMGLAGCGEKSSRRTRPEAEDLRLQAAGFLGAPPERIKLSRNDGRTSASFGDERREMEVEFTNDGTVRRFTMQLADGRDDAGKPGSFFAGQKLSATVVNSLEDLLSGRNGQAERRLSELENDVQAAGAVLPAAQLRTAGELAGSVRSALAADDYSGAAMALLPLYRLVEEARPRSPASAPLDLALLRHDVLKCRLLARSVAAIQSGNGKGGDRGAELWTALEAASVDAAARATKVALLVPGAPGDNLRQATAALGKAVQAREPLAIARYAGVLDAAAVVLDGLFARRALAL